MVECDQSSQMFTNFSRLKVSISSWLHKLELLSQFFAFGLLMSRLIVKILYHMLAKIIGYASLPLGHFNIYPVHITAKENK